MVRKNFKQIFYIKFSHNPAHLLAWTFGEFIRKCLGSVLKIVIIIRNEKAMQEYVVCEV